LAYERERWVWSANARPTPTDKLHLTLRFIGAVASGRVAEVVERLGVAFAPFEVALTRHVLWRDGIATLEPDAGNEALTALHDALATSLTALRLPVETRRFRPHVTMARDALGSTGPSATTVVLRADAFALVESRPDGSHVQIARYPAR
jgi:RNA 2',3'-cyclic 3'-phosphodiesterase